MLVELAVLLVLVDDVSLVVPAAARALQAGIAQPTSPQHAAVFPSTSSPSSAPIKSLWMKHEPGGTVRYHDREIAIPAPGLHRVNH